MTRTQEQILAGLPIAISLAAIGVSIRTERTLDAMEAMQIASTLGNSRSDPMRATVLGSLEILAASARADTADDLIYGVIVEDGFWADSIAVDWTNYVDATVSGNPLEVDGAWRILNVADNDSVWTIGGRRVWP